MFESFLLIGLKCIGVGTVLASLAFLVRDTIQAILMDNMLAGLALLEEGIGRADLVEDSMLAAGHMLEEDMLLATLDTAATASYSQHAAPPHAPQQP